MSRPVCKVAQDVMAVLRAHRGEKFDSYRLGELTGHPAKEIARVLAQRAGDLRLPLRRERVSGSGAIKAKYWFTDGAVGQVVSSEARHIARWMVKHGKAVRPSLVAAALRVAPELVAEQLEAWAHDGVAVRCELLTRGGIDRYEYRLSTMPGLDSRTPACAFRARVMA